MSILKQAHDIVFERNEEKERMYGPFEEGMEQTARIASELSRKSFDAFDVYNVLIALKLSRASWNYKEDNYLDAAAYIGSLDKYMKQKAKNEDTASKGRKATDKGNK